MEAFESLSEESRFRRFFFHKKSLSDSEVEQLANPDGINHIAYGVAAVEDGENEGPIAVGHCFRAPSEPDLAEIAIVTSDLWQGNGAGSELVKSLAKASLNAGIRRWLAVTLAENREMRWILKKYATKSEENATKGGVIEEIYTIKTS